MAGHLLREPAASAAPMITIAMILQRGTMRSVDHSLGDEVVDALLVLHLGDEDYLGVAAAHLLECLQVSDLHGCL